MNMGEALENHSIKVVECHHDDILILRVHAKLTLEEVKAYHNSWNEQWPDVPIAILGDDLDLEVIRRA